MPTIVMTDYLFDDMSVEEKLFANAGCELLSNKSRDPNDFADLVRDADAVMVQFAPFDAAMIESLQNAKAIVRYGIGYDNIDCEAARKKGIPVCNIPDYCIDEVADHTLSFILSSTRCLRGNCTRLVKGEWGLAVDVGQMRTLRDQTVGLIGAGRIGKEVIARLRPFKCEILVSDPLMDPAVASELGVQMVGFEELLAKSDILSLHCPSNSETRNIINAESLSAMKDGAIVINVGRGDLCDLDALTNAIRSGKISSAALDVFETEPLTEHPLFNMDNVLVNSHIASVSEKAIRKLRETAVELSLKAINDQTLPNIVNGL